MLSKRKLDGNDDDERSAPKRGCDVSYYKNEIHSSGGLKKAIHGNEFQMLFSVMISANNALSNNNNKLLLSMESEDFGDWKFDDLVLLENGEYRCFQFKHVQNRTDKDKIYESDLESSNLKNNYSLKKYWISYFKRSDSITAKSIKYLCICTNIGFGDDVLRGENWKGFLEDEDTNDPCFEGGKVYKFSCDAIIRGKIIARLKICFEERQVRGKIPEDSTNIFNEFLDKLRFLVDHYPNDEFLDKLRRRFRDEFKMSNDMVFDSFYTYMSRWMVHRKKNTEINEGKPYSHYLTTDDLKLFFNETENQISSFKMMGLSLEYYTLVSKLGIEFTELSTTLEDFLNGSSQVYCLNTLHPLLSVLKIFQTLNKIERYKDNRESFIIMRLNSLLNLQDDVVKAFGKEGANDLLIIDCDIPYSRDNIKRVFKLTDKMKDILNENKYKRIVVVGKDIAILEEFKDISQNSIFLEEDDGQDLLDLTTESQNNILRSSTVSLQGYPVSLSQLINDNDELKRLMKLDVLNKLLQDSQFEIGSKLPGLKEINEYYEKRVYLGNVIKATIQNSDCFHIVECSNNFYSVAQLPISQEILSISDTDEQYNSLCQRFSDRNIHWLKKDSNKIIWKKSNGSVDKIRQFIEANVKHRFKFDPSFVSKSRIIVSDESGSGKTTLLTKAALNYKEKHPHFLVLNINLNNHQATFHKFKNVTNINEAIKLLTELSDLKSELENGLLVHAIKDSGNIAIFLDGFDEISPTYKNIVINMVRLLKNTNIKLIFITTRPNMQLLLEKRLGLFAYTLEPFKEKNCVRLLKRLLKKSIDSIESLNEERLTDFSKRLLSILRSSLDKVEAKLAKTPLIIEMVALCFEKDFKSYHNDLKDTLCRAPKFLDIFYLYISFIKIKWNIYREDKARLILANADIIHINKTLFPSFLHNHSILAVDALFSQEQLDIILEDSDKSELKTLKEDIRKGEDKKGFILSVVNDKAQFSHRSFLFVFAAIFFQKRIGKFNGSEGSFPKINKFLLEVIYLSDYDILLRFFDRILIFDFDKICEESNEISDEGSKYMWHKKILDQTGDRYKCIQRIPNHCLQNYFTPDRAGRNPLHLIAHMGDFYAFEALRKFHSVALDFNAVDTLYGWDAVTYAIKRDSWYVIDAFLKHGASIKNALHLSTAPKIVEIASTYNLQHLTEDLFRNLTQEEIFDLLSNVYNLEHTEQDLITYLTTNQHPLHFIKGLLDGTYSKEFTETRRKKLFGCEPTCGDNFCFEHRSYRSRVELNERMQFCLHMHQENYGTEAQAKLTLLRCAIFLDIFPPDGYLEDLTGAQ